MRIAVTGGAGFIGSNLVKELCERGKGSRIIDDMSTGCLENVVSILKQGVNVECYISSIENLDKLTEQFEDIEYVYHLAAIPRIPRSVEDPIGTAKANIMGTHNVLEAARKSKVKRVVFASSSSVKGLKSPYALQKATGEMLCTLYNELYGLETVVLRYFNVYGPNMDAESDYATVVPRFMTEDPVTIYGDGEQTRCLTHVEDIVDATIRAMETTEANGHTFEIGAKSVSINELSLIVGKTAKYEPERPGEQKHSVANTKLAKQILGWKPKITLANGLRKL